MPVPPRAIKYIHTLVTRARPVFAAPGQEVWLARATARAPLRGKAPVKRLVDRFAKDAALCADLDQLRLLVEQAGKDLGFDYFALLHHSVLALPGSARIRIENYPDGWAEELVVRGLAVHDPVHLASRRTASGFAWAELGSLVRLDQRHRSILERSRHHGIGAGFTVPANVPGEPSGSCSFAVRTGRDLPLERLMCTELVGAHAFRAARRIAMPSPGPERPHLSRREIECLRLVALGKTDWEAASILGIGVETARHYVKRARAAYDVVSRTQLVVHGLRDDWLTFEDAIPPSGGMG